MINEKGRELFQSRRRGYRHLLAICAILCTVAIPTKHAAAQDSAAPADDERGRPFLITLSIGAGGPTGDTRCIAGGYLLPSVEVASRGKFFASGGVEWIQPAGPIEDCIRLPIMRATPDGVVAVSGRDQFNLDEGGVHFQGGLGYRGPLGLEARAKMGATRGQSAFPSEWLVSATAALGWSLWQNHLIVSLDRRWFRTPYWTQRCSTEQECLVLLSSERPEGAATRWRWRVVHALSIGVRF
jgi:hypothetical protein